MIHQYQNNGYNIVLDVNSGAVHVVDQEAYDVIAVLNEMNAEHTPETLKAPETETVLKEKLGDRYTEEDLKDILDAVTELTEQGRLFTKDIYENLIGIVKQRKTVVKALCLHIAHDCNLACQYCFAEEGEYHGRRALMSYEVGKKALDFLVANSGSYETPGGTILMAAHEQLEELVLDRATYEVKKDLGNKFAQIVYEGKWYTPLREAIQAFVDVTQQYVTGEVKFRLYKGNIIRAGETSPYSLYSESLASFTTGDLYDHHDADGFINLFGLPLKVRAMKMQEVETQKK